MVKGVEAQAQALLTTLKRADNFAKKAERWGFLGKAIQNAYAAKVERQIAKLPQAEQIKLPKMGSSIESLIAHGEAIPEGQQTTFLSELSARGLLNGLSEKGDKWQTALQHFNEKLPEVAKTWTEANAQGLLGTARDDFDTVEKASLALHRAAFNEGLSGKGFLLTALDKLGARPPLDVEGNEVALGKLSRELGDLKHYTERAGEAKAKLDKALEKPVHTRIDQAIEGLKGDHSLQAVGELVSLVGALQGSKGLEGEVDRAKGALRSHVQGLQAKYDEAAFNAERVEFAAQLADPKGNLRTAIDNTTPRVREAYEGHMEGGIMELREKLYSDAGANRVVYEASITEFDQAQLTLVSSRVVREKAHDELEQVTRKLAEVPGLREMATAKIEGTKETEVSSVEVTTRQERLNALEKELSGLSEELLIAEGKMEGETAKGVEELQAQVYTLMGEIAELRGLGGE